MEKLLEDAQIKLTTVVSDVFGVSGRQMLAALLAGERDPQVLAQLARGWLCQPELAPGFSCDLAPPVVGGWWGVLLGVGPGRCCGSWGWTWSAAARAVSAICRICWL